MLNDLMDYPYGFINDETNNKLLMGLGDLVIELRACLNSCAIGYWGFLLFQA